MQKEPAKTFRIGELAKRAGKTVRTIHFYEELGLLHPAERSPGGFRMYNDEALNRIHWIEQIQDLGFSLVDIREFLEGLHAQETGPQSMNILQGFYQEKLAQTRATIQKMKALETDLLASLEYLQACQGCTSTDRIDSCVQCENDEHANNETPRMVAAIATSA